MKRLGKKICKAFVPEVIDLDIPRSWAASKAWTPENLGDVLSCTKVRAKRCQSRQFMYADQFSSILLPDDHAGKVEHVEMSFPDLIAKCWEPSSSSASTDGWHYYYTHPVKQFAPEMMDSVQNWEELQVEGDISHGMAPYVSAWVGGSGVVTQAHYDVANNVFVQVYGTKCFHLYPPSKATELHVYPDAHPRARKSQVDFDDPDLKLLPLFETLGDPYMKVTLKPGDALYIPPFWFHHVEALTPSVSINVFSESSVRLAAVSSLGLLPHKFLQDLYQSRYRPLFETGRSVHGNRESLMTTKSIPTMTSLERVCEKFLSDHFVLGQARDIATEVKDKFQTMKNEILESEAEHVSGLQDIIAAHLVELVLVQNIGVGNLTPSTFSFMIKTLDSMNKNSSFNAI
mmetsp:Transcript_5960/g.9286  ORF Transcript_5960/g.9286 Transcript_5960/m.9286 type:complete len:401 (-) Transcript_5960:243-1445(-)